MKFIIALIFLSLLTATTTASDNLVIVLDTSGSMSEKLGKISRMQAAHSAIIGVVEQMPDDINVGLLTFDGWAYELSQINKASLRDAILNTTPSGGTPLGEYLKEAANALLKQRDKDRYGTYRLVVVTDGEANDQPLLDGILPVILGRGIILDSVGIGMTEEHTLSNRSKSYVNVNSPESLTTALAKVYKKTAPEVTTDQDFEYISDIPKEIAPLIIEAVSNTNNETLSEEDAVIGSVVGSIFCILVFFLVVIFGFTFIITI